MVSLREQRPVECCHKSGPETERKILEGLGHGGHVNRNQFECASSVSSFLGKVSWSGGDRR